MGHGALAQPSAHGRLTSLAPQGRHIFRFETFGDEAKWTDQLRMHEVIRTSVDPYTQNVFFLEIGGEVKQMFVDFNPTNIHDYAPGTPASASLRS